MKKLTTTILGGLLLLTPAANAGVLEDKNCGSCHRLKAEDSEKSFSGPDLHYAGNKFQEEWLKQYLKKPEVIRPAGFVTDPGFVKKDDLPPHIASSEKDANTMTRELMSLKISSPTPVALEPLSKGLRARIKYQFERTFGCISCHQSLNLTGKVRGGISGPSLVNAGNRLQADWIADWLKTPETYTAKMRMPRYKMEPVTLNQFTQFLMTLKKENIK
ncbi:MAG: c-type cytochrome [Nitrospinae bacterium]|nr:c-type cytochrome [Nitrospinota bacterium]